MNAPTCGSLFSGAGLLDAGLSLAGWEHAWLCESVPERRDILRARFPAARVFDDVRTLRGPFAADTECDAVRQQPVAVGGCSGPPVTGRAGEAAADATRLPEGGPSAGARPNGERARPCADDVAGRVDLIVGGFPCKGASTAGKREGFEHAESVLWHEMRRVIGEVRPRYVVVENVANLLGMAASPGEPAGSMWGIVVGDLAALGFGDIRWDCIPAGAVGAPHLRDRVFCVAGYAGWSGRPVGWQPERAGGERARHVADEGPADVADADEAHDQGHWRAERVQPSVPGDHGHRTVAVEWGEYGPAVRRWEAIHGTAPEPLIRRLDDGRADVQRMRARLDRQRLSALGDGVHVYVGQIVGEYVMGIERARLTGAA